MVNIPILNLYKTPFFSSIYLNKYQRILTRKFQLLRKKIKMFHFLCLCKSIVQIVTYPYPEDHALNNLESILPDDASIQF